MRRRLALLVALLCSGTGIWGQVAESPAPAQAPAPHPQFFAGLITALDQRHIQVWRKLVGRSPESRDFLIDSQTKMNPAVLKMKSRVTVRYRRTPQGDLALEIQVRPAPRTTKAP